MDIQNILRRCIDVGVQLAIVEGSLRVHFDGANLDPELLSLLKANKDELLRYLQAGRPIAGADIPKLGASVRARVRTSPAQRRMVLLDQIDRSSARYNMVGAYALHGSVDREALEASLNEVIARHEALRSRYETVDGEVWQIVDQPFALRWSRSDVFGMDEVGRNAAVQELLRHENTWCFDLETGPLIRASSMRVDVDVEVLVLNLHHIACDGWSVEIIKREIAALYGMRRDGTDMTLPLLPVQYADYCEWLRDKRQMDRLAKQFEYWTKQLDGMPELHSLALDHPRPLKQTYAGSKVHRIMERDRLELIKQACLAHDVTLFMYLQTTLTAIFCTHAYERDIVMGFPVAGRRHDDLADTVGLFVNTLVLRNRVEGNPTFAQMLAQNKAVILEALGNQDVPFDALVERLKIFRSRAYSPLVQIVFALQSQIERGLALAGVESNAIDNQHEPVKFDLQIVAQEIDGQLRLEWHFNRDLFVEASIERMADSFSLLLGALPTHANTPLFSLPLVEAPPSDIMSGNMPAAKLYRRIEAMIEDAARRLPDRIAVSFNDRQLSYSDLDERAEGLARMLGTLGVGRGSVVGLYLERSLELIVGMLGVLKAGAAYLPMDPVHPLPRLHAIFQDSGAKVLLTQRALQTGFAVAAAHCVLLDDDATYLSVDAEGTPRASYPVEDPAYVIYTSGTTGIPKGVVVAHAGLDNLLVHMDALAPLEGPWSGSLWSSISFDASVYETFSVLCRGGTLHIVPDEIRLDPERLFQWMDGRQVASTFMHAGYLEPYADHVRRQGGRALRRMMVGAEPIPTSHVAAIVRELPELQVINAYGPTETTICCTLYLFGRVVLPEGCHVPIGSAVDGMTVRIMNIAGEPVPRGAVGELYVGGVGVALGYLHRPELDEAKFVFCADGASTMRFYRTGDLVRYRADGALEFLGRMDEQVKIRGFRVELGEVEARLCQLAEISDAVALAWGEGIHRQLVAYVVLRRSSGAPGAAPAEVANGIRRELLGALPEYMVPASIVVVGQIPLTANGKVQRDALPAPAPLGPFAVVAPRNEAEEALLAIWKDILGIESAGVTDDFFALGGQSLLATRLVSRIRNEFRIPQERVSLGDILEHPTVEALAQALGPILTEELARRKAMRLELLTDSVEEGFF